MFWVYALHSISRSLSTGEPHHDPAAKESTILIFNSHWETQNQYGDCGHRLVLILSYNSNRWMPDDLVFVYDWRNAVKTMVGPFINSIQ